MASFATEGESVAELFAQPNFWKSSTLLDSPAPLGKDFFDLVIKHKIEPVVEGSLALQDGGYFRTPPDLDSIRLEQPSVELSGIFDHIPSRHSSPEADADPWLFQDETTARTTEFKTWDGFDLPKARLEPATFITEAGSTAYDALLSSKSNPCGIESHDSYETLDPRGYAACLLAMSLGRESVLFLWNQEKKTFKPALPLTKIPGYSGESLSSIVQLCTSCGEACRRLRSFIEKTYSSTATSSHVALANAVDRLLLVVHDELGCRGLRTRSILQLQSLVRPVYTLLSYFHKLVSKIKRPSSDSDLLSIIYNEAQSAELSEPFLRDTMGEILRMVSKPWTDFVEEWIGLKPEDGIRMSKDGPGKGFVKVDTNMWIDDQGFELAEPDYFLDSDNMPTFVPGDVGQTIFETGRNLRFLQTHHPQHPLSSVSHVTRDEALKLKWQYDWDSITRVEQKALAYHRAVSETLRQNRAAQNDWRSASSVDGRVDDEHILQFFGKDEARLQETVLASIAQLDRPVEKADTWDQLSQILRANLFSDRKRDQLTGTEFSPHWSLLPLLSFGPMVYAQARLVNRECLQLLFREHDLRAHLRLQRSFQLLGNGMFSSRLSNALFSPDMETTERQSAVARSGVGMGLRLASRENWPPASSELRLALMGVLTDSYHDEHSVGQTSAASTSKDQKIPGDLSFGIRDLSPEEMEKCIDPGSLEALDFLRMSYHPPHPLLPIMTPGILHKYDRIFKLMLRVLRVLSVVDQLFRDVSPRLTRWADPENAILRFRIEAHHFVSNVARYFVDTGIDQPWRRFEAWLDRVEKEFEDEDFTDAPSTVSPDRLGEQHERTLDEIMLALLLRKRQQPVLNLLEEIFTVILRFAKKCRLRGQGAQVPEQEIKELYKTFRAKVEVFISVCRGMTEKSGYGPKKNGEIGGRAEENSIVMLLLLLDMSNYYTKR
ncbi:Gamma-tubulin complex component 6 [Cytospora mali]|uniref:Spindle pole body component n=1 Tax=Cytospora mali TaxID=578113 RepID=A0A194UPW2_CYTMA|nr:Gamma-tubulin complex component 6 [Valsa mali var. pyri (nom. inval.)]